MKALAMFLLITMSASAFAGNSEASDLFTYDKAKLKMEMAELDLIANQMMDQVQSTLQIPNSLSEISCTSTTLSFGSSNFSIPSFMKSSYLSWAGILIQTGQSAETEMPRWLACILVGGVMFGIYILVAALT